MKKAVMLTLMLVAGAYMCYAGKIDGKWKADMGGQMEITFTFKVDGEKLTGTVTSDMGNSEIKNGKVKGEEFTFDVEMNGAVIGHTCKLDGEVIKMNIKMPEGMGGGDGMGEIILKRAEEK